MNYERWVFRVYCNNEQTYVTSNKTVDYPISCPNDVTHTIDTSKTHKVSVNQSSKPLFSTTFGRDVNKPYYELDNSSFVEISIFPYDGKDITSDINYLDIMASATKNNTEIECRLVNNISGDIILHDTFNMINKDVEYLIGLTGFSNLPLYRSSLSFQARLSSSNNSKIRLYSLNIK